MENKSASLVAGSIIFAGLLIALSNIYGGDGKNIPSAEQIGAIGALPSDEAQGGAPVDLPLGSRDVILGNPDAPVTFIEYGDYQCPFCARLFTESESKIREEYVKANKVRMVYRNFAFLGPESFAAAEAAECAKDQRQFWAYHDSLYQAEFKDGVEHNGNLNRDLFIKIAGDLKLDTTAFAKCFDDKKYVAAVQEDVAAGRNVGVNSTPTVFINGEQVRGALPFEQFKTLIDAML